MSGHRKPSISEEDVESMLSDFFRREMPAELRRPEFAGRTTPHSPVSKSAAGRPALVGSIIAACCLLLALTVLVTGGKRRIDRSRGGKTTGDLFAKNGATRQDAAKTGISLDKTASRITKKSRRPASLPALYVPVEMQWMEALKQSFFSEYLPHYFGTDDWELQFKFELHHPNEPRKPRDDLNPHPKLPEQQ